MPARIAWSVAGRPSRSKIAWPYPGPAVAGVNTYGLSGVFVHLVVGAPEHHEVSAR